MRDVFAGRNAYRRQRRLLQFLRGVLASAGCTGKYFNARLQRLSAGDVSVDPAPAAEFWTLIMGEHASFIAHLLDPSSSVVLVARCAR